jgi:hypothetical protein
MKKELIQKIAKALLSYGYDVYISKDGEYGFYTNGKRVVAFGSPCKTHVNFYGCYSSERNGTGWEIEREMGVPTGIQAGRYIEADVPYSLVQEAVKYSTPEQYLKFYGGSRFEKCIPTQNE